MRVMEKGEVENDGLERWGDIFLRAIGS